MKSIFAVFILILSAVPSFAAFPGSTLVPAQAKVEVAKGQIRLSAQAGGTAQDGFKMALFTQAGTSSSLYTTAPSTVTSFLSTGEVSGSGYTVGGQALTGCTVTTSSNNAVFTCTIPSWPAAITADAAVIYDISCDGSTRCSNLNQVIGIIPFSSIASTGSGPFTFTTAPTITIQ